LVPCLRKSFTQKYARDPDYDGLISLLGFTPETVIIAHQFAQPKTLVVLHTAETAHLLDTVVQYTKISVASFFHEPFVEEPSRNIYIALERALGRFPRGSKIVIELTGGKKTMGGALAVAAGMLNIDLLYIDYEDYMPNFRKPKPASTFIHLVENPLGASVDIFGGLEVVRALEFFNLGRLDAAEQLLLEVAKRMGNPRVAELCSRLAGFYSAWNRFEFADALARGNELFEQCLRFHHELSSRVSFDLHRFKLQIETIEKLNLRERVTTLINFYYTADRYERNNQHDIAALLYYRTVEDVFSNRLHDLAPNFDRSSPDYTLFGLSREELAHRFSEAKANLLKGDPTNQGLPERLALMDAVLILDALGDKCLSEVHRRRILGLAETRNHSIFAHGQRPLNAQSIQSLKDLSTECLSVYLSEHNLGTIEALREAFMFMPLTHREQVIGGA
jgi:CRISPR-associated protein (TIGR02710 family)